MGLEREGDSGTEQVGLMMTWMGQWGEGEPQGPGCRKRRGLRCDLSRFSCRQTLWQRPQQGAGAVK